MARSLEHAVIVAFEYGLDELEPLFELGDKLESAIAAADAGNYDGHEIAMDLTDGTLWMYGPDADKLFAAVIPVLEKCPFTANARVKLRYGPLEDGTREHLVTLPERSH